MVALRISNWDEVIDKAAPRATEANAPVMHPGLLQVIGECNVTAHAVLGCTKISVSDLLSIRPGDIICLDRQVDAPLDIRIGERTKFLGSVQVEQRKFVVTVESISPREDANGS